MTFKAVSVRINSLFMNILPTWLVLIHVRMNNY